MPGTSVASRVIRNLDSRWFRDRPLQESLSKTIRAVYRSKTTREQKREEVARFLKESWQNYANAQLAEVAAQFSRLEGVLLGVVPFEGDRYRDHFIHTFNTFLFGALLLSSLTSSANPRTLRQLLKVGPEDKGRCPFRRPYNTKERLRFLWNLMATLHDIAIPVNYLSTMGRAYEKYLTSFGLASRTLGVDYSAGTTAKLDYYARLLARFYGGALNAPASRTGPLVYPLPAAPNPVFLNQLSHAFEVQDHGALGAICVFRSVESSFLMGQPTRDGEALTAQQAANYVDAVLEQDVARSALAVALHSMSGKEEYGGLKVSFTAYPLTFLLILSDVLQDFFRSEFVHDQGRVAEVVPMKAWPKTDVTTETGTLRLCITVELEYEEPAREEDKKALIDEYNAYQRRRSPAAVRDLVSFKELVTARAKDTVRQLTGKLDLTEDGHGTTPVEVKLTFRCGGHHEGSHLHGR
jgi:hypothetical protein